MEQTAIRLSGNKTTLAECYQAGRQSVLIGATEENCHFRFFGSPESTAEWERGARDARQEK